MIIIFKGRNKEEDCCKTAEVGILEYELKLVSIMLGIKPGEGIEEKSIRVIEVLTIVGKISDSDTSCLLTYF